MTEEQLGEIAVRTVSREDSDATNVRASSIVRGFAGGDLVVVLVDYPPDEDDEDGEGSDNDYYVHIRESVPYVYEYVEDLARGAAAYKPPILPLLLRSGGVPGIIAILITLTICWLAVRQDGPPQIPEVLSAALTAILGFYFGQVASRQS